MKLELTTATKIAIWKIGNAAFMCKDNEITSDEYERISLEAINEANEAATGEWQSNIPDVTGSLPINPLKEQWMEKSTQPMFHKD